MTSNEKLFAPRHQKQLVGGKIAFYKEEMPAHNPMGGMMKIRFWAVSYASSAPASGKF